MEIGSIYEMDPRSLPDFYRGEKVKFRLAGAEKYGKNHIGYTASGREAIALALKSFALNSPDAEKRCLLPAYMCDTVFFPFEKEGWDIHFYSVERNMETQKDRLCQRLEDVRPKLLFIHAFYGVDTWSSMRSLLCKWRREGICIMEDVTQSYYLAEAGKEADYVVGSLRKWYPVPDGGFVASDQELALEAVVSQSSVTAPRIELMTQKWEYLHSGRSRQEKAVMKAEYLKKNRETEERLDCFYEISALSKEARAILEKTDEAECRKRRMENSRCLAERTQDKRSFTPVFPQIEQSFEWAPLYFPIYAQDRSGLQRFLGERDIYAPVLWPVGRENENCLTEAEEYIFRHLLAIPIDQRYGLGEMEQIAEALEAYEDEYTGETVGIRADANETVASGHVMRCITIAKQLIMRGKKVIFFTADENAHNLLEAAGMKEICLHTAWDDMEQETERLKQELKHTGCRKLLVDSYRVTAGYFEELKSACRLIYIDDCFEEVYPVDMVINYNAFYHRFPYEEAYGMSGAKVRTLLGTSYVPLREEFSILESLSEREAVQEPQKEDRQQVLLASGGGDVFHALSGILRSFWESFPDVFCRTDFHVIVGSFQNQQQELIELAQSHSNIRLYFGVKDVAELMRRCDAAVSAAGTMLFELSALRIPSVFFVSADNQKYDGEFFGAEGRMLYGGDIRTEREQCLGNICLQLERLLGDRNMRCRMKEKLAQVTDGKGAGRIAEEIICL